MELVTDNNMDFYVLREQPSEVFPNLNKAQEIIIQQLAMGKSYSYIAKKVFGVHYTTLMKQTKSIAFIQVLTGVNNAKEVITLEEVRIALTNIVKTSNNENAVINAAKVLLSIGKTITIDQIAESLSEEEKTQERAREILEKLGIEGDED